MSDTEDYSQDQKQKIAEDEESEKAKINENSDTYESEKQNIDENSQDKSHKEENNENSDQDKREKEKIKENFDQDKRLNENTDKDSESEDQKESTSNEKRRDNKSEDENTEPAEKSESLNNQPSESKDEKSSQDDDNDSENSDEQNHNDETNQKYIPYANNPNTNPQFNGNYDELNPYDLKEDKEESLKSSEDEKDPENVATRSIDKDDDISVSSDSENKQIPRAISADDIAVVEQPEEPKDFDDLPFLEKYKWPLISSSITLVFVIIASAVAGGVKKDVRMHIIPKTLEIVNKVGGYIIWGIHCVGLVALPFLFIILFKEKVRFYQIWGPPLMMLLNMIGGFLPIKGSFFPLIIELLITMYYLFHLPFRAVYRPKYDDFWAGELTLMFLGFIYISSALGSSTLSYLLYGSYIRVDGRFEGFPSNPHYAIEYMNYLYSLKPYHHTTGGYLACYSLFTFLSVGIGFTISLKNSILMSIPFLMLCICTVIETHAIGTLLFCQLLIHIIYIFFLHFHKTRRWVTGVCCNCCLECCYATLTTIMIGDIIGFSLVAFPILQLSIFGDGPKNFNWGGFIGGSLVIFIGIIFHVFYSFDSHWWQLIFACAGFFGGALVFGLTFSGYVPLIRAFTYEITYVTWSFALCFWGYSSGYSPTLFKAYNGLISLASLVMIELYEGVGWMEIVFAIVQVFFDTAVITYVQRIETKYIAWTVFSVAGIVVLGFLVGVAAIICLYIALLILSKFCQYCSDYLDYQQALDKAQGLKSGDTFECAGKTWVVQ